jgi:putative salt-induced outer membrane protein YdiY
MLPATALIAQEEERAWQDTAELAGVFTSGNSESSQWRLANVYTRKGVASTFLFEVSAVRAENAVISRRAIGTVDNYVITEDKDNRLTAENYGVRLRYDHDITEQTQWYISTDWMRDVIAGIDSRANLGAGLANTWRDTETSRLKTGYGLAYVIEDSVGEQPGGASDNYPAVALSLDHMQKVTGTSTYTQAMAVNFNLDESDDYRVDWKHGFSVSVSGRISVKLGLHFQYDNAPSFESLSLDDGTAVFFELDELDTIFTTSLSIDF